MDIWTNNNACPEWFDKHYHRGTLIALSEQISRSEKREKHGYGLKKSDAEFI